MQWLGTFGKANAAYAAKDNDRLARLLGEALELGARRAGGLAFEYTFQFDGGRPPWVSSLAQGTGIQALSRAASRLGDPAYADAARSALGVFRTPPPEGVRVGTAAGAHYLQYSFAPRLRIVNGFVQSLNGLHDLAVSAQRRRRPDAVHRRRGRAARGAARLRHGRVVAVLAPRRRVLAELPRAPARLPALALQPPDDRREEGARAAGRGTVLRHRAAFHGRPRPRPPSCASPTSARGPSGPCACASAWTSPRGSR